VLNYAAGALSPATAAALTAFVATPNGTGTPETKAALETPLVADLNKVLASGVLTRANLESAYPTQITKYTSRGTYILIDLPEIATVTRVAGKTMWNLRERLTVTWPTTGDLNRAVANFVTGGKVTGVANDYLRAGDIIQDNIVNLSDFTILQQTFGDNVDLRADLDGNNRVNVVDYGLLQGNFGQVGDPAVN